MLPRRRSSNGCFLPSKFLQHNVVPFRAGNELSVEPKKRKGRRKQMILTVGTAVLLGTGFGFGVLHVLDGTKEEKKHAGSG
ncbi:hypothetical protein GCM10020331_035000 [Ectobacillus funiculus]